MVCFPLHMLRTAVRSLSAALPRCGVGALGLAPLLAGGSAAAQCCGQPVAPPVATQTYRLDYQTVYDEEQVTAYRTVYETVYDTQNYTVQKPVWETETRERRYTVQRPVWETQTREERYTVMKPVYETQVQDQSYNVVRDVVETSTREGHPVSECRSAHSQRRLTRRCRCPVGGRHAWSGLDAQPADAQP